MFSGLWGKEPPKPTAKELVKEQKRTVRRSQRGIDREMRHLNNQEKKLLADIKKNATAGNTGAAKTLAKELVRTRATMSKLTQTSTQLGSISMRATEMGSTMAITGAIGKSTQAMAAMNKEMNPVEQQKIAQQFMAENDKAAMMSEQFDDMFDSMMDSDEDADADEMVNKVLDEIGIDSTSGLKMAPQQVQPAAEVVDEPAVDGDLEARMAKLMGT